MWNGNFLLKLSFCFGMLFKALLTLICLAIIIIDQSYILLILHGCATLIVDRQQGEAEVEQN